MYFISGETCCCAFSVLYLHSYSIFFVTTEPEQNWELWKAGWQTLREQQGYNSNCGKKRSLGRLECRAQAISTTLSGSCPSAVLGEQLHRRHHLMDQLLLLLNGGVPAGCLPLVPSAGTALVGCIGPPFPAVYLWQWSWVTEGRLVPLPPGAAAGCETAQSCRCQLLASSSALAGKNWEWELPL